jgi:hypothetical protein
MAPFDPNHIKIGPGTLYAAPLGTTEPSSVTGAWPAGWTALGYTDKGSEFDLTPAVADVTVEEEYWPVGTKITGYAGKLSFMLAEATQANFLLAMNAGIGSGLISGASGTNADGSVWAEMPSIGSEVFIMLGWDALPEATTQGQDPFSRLVIRKALQSGAMKITAQKGNNKRTYSCEFHIQKPFGVQPFRAHFPANLVS